MRIDCYNACETWVSEVEYGDTFYYKGSLYMRVSADIIGLELGDCVIVDLAKGDLTVVKGETDVILADTKIVVNTKDTN